MLIDYARVSKADGSQSLELQRDALQGRGRRRRPLGRHGGKTFALSKAQVRLAQAAMAHRDNLCVRALP